MMKTLPATNPDAYVAGLSGWCCECVEMLRAAVRSVAQLEEVIKWGHLVYLFGGPVLLIRAEDDRVLFGFWRGQRLRDIEPRLTPSGKYEMATLIFTEDTSLDPKVARRLAKEAVALNKSLGDPTSVVKKKPSKQRAINRKS